MEAINALLRAGLDGLLGLLAGLPDWVALAVLALLVTILVLPIIKWTFNPDLAERFKRKVFAGLFEIRLFNDRLGATFRGLLDVLRYTAAYMAAWLLPLVVMSVPMLPIFAHLHFHYGYDGLQPGATTLLRAEFAADRETGKPAASLAAPDGLRVETPALWVPARRELIWRLGAETPGDYELTLSIDGREYAKSVTVSDEATRRSPLRPRAAFFDQLLYPAEPPLAADSPLARITIDYGEHGSFLLVPNWCWILVILSLPFFLLLKGRFGVEI
jgi:hypothetical protein